MNAYIKIEEVGGYLIDYPSGLNHRVYIDGEEIDEDFIKTIPVEMEKTDTGWRTKSMMFKEGAENLLELLKKER